MIRELAVLSLSTLAAAGAQAQCVADRVDLRGDWGRASFAVEIADDAEEQRRGLMFRESLPRGAGMLFVYGSPRPVSFWMRNTLISLDMVFVDAAGVVTKVHANAVPGDETPIRGEGEVLAVLEINGGLAEIYGISPGTELRHPAFADVGPPPAWPCD